jgi:hypothetical protein
MRSASGRNGRRVGKATRRRGTRRSDGFASDNGALRRLPDRRRKCARSWVGTFMLDSVVSGADFHVAFVEVVSHFRASGERTGGERAGPASVVVGRSRPHAARCPGPAAMSNPAAVRARALMRTVLVAAADGRAARRASSSLSRSGIADTSKSFTARKSRIKNAPVRHPDVISAVPCGRVPGVGWLARPSPRRDVHAEVPHRGLLHP